MAEGAAYVDLNVRAALQMREYREIAGRIAADSPGVLLDWGCGHGQMSDLLRARGVETVAYDYRPDEGQEGLHRLPMFPDVEARFGSDQVQLPYEDDEFDSALSCGVLEHVAHPGPSLEELRRVLKPGGTLYVYKLPNRSSWTEWIARRLRGRVFYHGLAPYDHLYELSEAKALLTRCGFAVTEARYANVVPLMFPLATDNPLVRPLWGANTLLSRVSGLRRFANNVELVARASRFAPNVQSASPKAGATQLR